MKTTNENWSLQNSYTELPSSFYKKIKPSKVKNPKLIYFNEKLSKQLNLEFLNNDVGKITGYLSGNILPDNSNPIAQALQAINLVILLCSEMVEQFYLGNKKL